MLIVEDDEKISSFIVKGLELESYTVGHVANGEEGLHLALHESYYLANLCLHF